MRVVLTCPYCLGLKTNELGFSLVGGQQYHIWCRVHMAQIQTRVVSWMPVQPDGCFSATSHGTVCSIHHISTVIKWILQPNTVTIESNVLLHEACSKRAATTNNWNGVGIELHSLCKTIHTEWRGYWVLMAPPWATLQCGSAIQADKHLKYSARNCPSDHTDTLRSSSQSAFCPYWP